VLNIWIHQLRPEKEDRMRNWLVELNSRADEVRMSFSAGTVRAEQACIVPGMDGPLLVYVSEAADQRLANMAYDTSELPIDREHRAVMEECVLTPLDVVPLYDVSAG
jgi:hypothetical protein